MKIVELYGKMNIHYLNNYVVMIETRENCNETGKHRDKCPHV